MKSSGSNRFSSSVVITVLIIVFWVIVAIYLWVVDDDDKVKVSTTTTTTTTEQAARWESPDEYVVAPSTTTTTKPRPPKTTRSATRTHNLSAIRNCESGGNYSAVSRTGKYRGAYQFDQRTWDRFAADEYKGTDPAAAPPEVQDQTAARVTYDAWPNC